MNAILVPSIECNGDVKREENLAMEYSTTPRGGQRGGVEGVWHGDIIAVDKVKPI